MKENLLRITFTAITTAILTALLMHALGATPAERRALNLARGFIDGKHDSCPSLEEIKLLPGELQTEIVSLRSKYLANYRLNDSAGTGPEREQIRAAQIIHAREAERALKEANKHPHSAPQAPKATWVWMDWDDWKELLGLKK